MSAQRQDKNQDKQQSKQQDHTGSDPTAHTGSDHIAYAMRIPEPGTQDHGDIPMPPQPTQWEEYDDGRTQPKQQFYTELVMILDRSGSMGGLESDTIGGYNAMLQRQRDTGGRVVVSTVLFDDRCEVLYDRVPLERLPQMTRRDYYVRGCTALLDALGGAIHHIAGVHRRLPAHERPSKTIFVITTDGMENASRTYDYRRVQQMVRREEKRYGWEFLFLGANMDAIATAARMGISADRAATYLSDSAGTALNYEVLGDAVCEMRAVPGRIDGTWKQRIDADVQLRAAR